MDEILLNETIPDVSELIVTPDEADRFMAKIPDIERWQQQYAGRTAYGLTIGTFGKPHIYITRPHAHEPAGTAACFEWIRRLTCDTPDSWSNWVLTHFRISFMADANPSGSQRPR
jgi:hypothetical protein